MPGIMFIPKLVVIAIYLLAMIAIGIVSRRKAREADDFFVAGRKGSTLFITGSLLATIIGGSATVGMAGRGFTMGLSGVWWLLVGSIGLLVLGLFFARKVREFGLYTLPELVAKQYDRRVALAGSILIVIAWMGIIAGQIVAAGTIMSVMGIGEPILWMSIFAGVFILYTVLGGQYAIIRTDTLQAVVIFAGIFGGLALLLSRLGGFGGLKDSLSPEQFAFPLSSQFGGYELISLLLLVGLTYVVGPDIYSRLFCARDVGVARKSVFWAALLIVPLALGITMIGIGASVLFPDIASEQALPTVIQEVLPPFLGGIVLAALLCAVMSSADTCLLSASTILTMDIIKQLRSSLSPEKALKVSRWGIVLLGLVSLLLAWRLGGVINSLLFAYTIYTSGLILPVIVGFYKDKLKVTSLGALMAVVGGGITALIIKIFEMSALPGTRWLDMLGLLVGVVLLFVVSFIENRVRASRNFAPSA